MSPRRPRACGPRRGSRSINAAAQAATHLVEHDVARVGHAHHRAHDQQHHEDDHPGRYGPKERWQGCLRASVSDGEVASQFPPAGARCKPGLSGPNEPPPPRSAESRRPLAPLSGVGTRVARRRRPWESVRLPAVTQALLSEVPVDWAIWLPLSCWSSCPTWFPRLSLIPIRSWRAIRRPASSASPSSRTTFRSGRSCRGPRPAWARWRRSRWCWSTTAPRASISCARG